MNKPTKQWWYAFTPAGSLVYETGSTTRQKCIDKLLTLAAHMPYGTWEKFVERGYTVEQLPIEP